VTTDFLFREFPESPEGELTAFRAALVNATTLASVGERLNMSECLLLSKGESKDTGRARATILANAFEAVVGALYLDQGYDAARAFIAEHILTQAAGIVASGAWQERQRGVQWGGQGRKG